MEEESRRPRQPGRKIRRWSREPVYALPDDIPGWYTDDDDGDGSAGVREPRHPKPPGPLAGAGEAPEPEEPLFARLGDPRY